MTHKFGVCPKVLEALCEADNNPGAEQVEADTERDAESNSTVQDDPANRVEDVDAEDNVQRRP